MKPLDEDQESIFFQALELPSEGERAAYLARACGEDEALLALIEEMLRAHGKGDDYLEPSAVKENLLNSVLTEETPAKRIGRYKLLQEIGEGGFGVVYMAEQQEPVVRKVALKIIKEGMDTRQVVARFESERQALAMMEHPNIARVFDAGATETGRPYFVMELVSGIPITDFCDENKYSTEKRLALFQDVCGAIQHAHQKGVIHRDIKPSNVLVTLHGDTPVVKVIDFGIAKATRQRLTDKTLFTQFQHFIGTPAYMSPEQASMSGLDVDTRSDVYSLGILLYELLVGRTPFDARTLLEKGIDEVRRVIREEEAPRPSTMWQTLQGQEQSQTAQQRSSDPRRLQSQLRGELDWIVIKALDKDRTRRYESASGLLGDIQSFLNDEPVTAVAPTLAYRMGKVFRKHRQLLVGAAALFVILFLATAFSSWQAWEARRSSADAEAARAEMSVQLEKANQAEAEAEAAESRATKNVSLLALQRGQDHLDQQRVSPALAYLAQSLRVNPMNRIASGQLSLALMQGKYARRVMDPLAVDGQICSLYYSPNGRVIVGRFCRGGEAMLWDAETGQPIGKPLQYDKEASWLRLSPDSRFAVLVARSALYFWDLRTGGLLTEPIPLEGDWEKLAGFFSHGGRRFAFGERHQVRVFDTITHKEILPRLSLDPWVTKQRFSPDGEVVVGFSKHRMRVWDLETGKALSDVLQTEGDYESSWMEFVPHQRRFIVTGEDQADLWDYEEGIHVNAANSNDPRLRLARISPSGQSVATRTGDEHVWLWNGELSRMIGAPLSHPAQVKRMEFSPNGTQLLVTCADRYAYLWDLVSRELVVEPIRLDGAGRAEAFSPDGTKVSLGGWYNSVASWFTSPPGLNGFEIPESSPDVFGNQVISPDGRWLLLHGDRIAELYEVETGLKRGSAPVDQHYQNSTTPFGADSSFVVLSHENRTVQIYSLPGWERMGEPLSHDAPIISYDVSKDGHRIVTGAKDGTVRLWDLDADDRLRARIRHDSSVWRVRYGPESRIVWTTSLDRTAVGWDALTGEQVAGPFDHGEPVHRLVVGPRSERLYTETSENRGVSLLYAWDVKKGELLWKRQADEHYIRSLDVSPDGKWLISGAVDGGSHFFHAATGEIHGQELVHGSVNEYSRFHPDSSMVVTSGNDGVVRLWDVESTALIGLIRQFDGPISRANFSPDGRFLLQSGKGYEFSLREVPKLEEVVPESMLNLTEAIAGLRVDANGRLEGVSVTELEQLRRELDGVSHGGYFGRFQRWLVANPLERTVTPSSPLETRGALQRYLESGRVLYLHRILHLDPTNRGAMLALAAFYQQQEDGEPRGRFYRELAEHR